MSESPYQKKLREKYERANKALSDAKEKYASLQPPSPEEMYLRSQDAVSRSLSKEELKNLDELIKPKKIDRSGSSLSRSVPTAGPEYYEVLKQIPVDSDRSIEVRYNPEHNTYDYAATKTKLRKRTTWDLDPTLPPPIPQKMDIANLKMTPSGYVQMVSAGGTGAKEGAIDRILMEAVKDNMIPNSSNLLPAGKKMVARKAIEMRDKEEYLDKIRKFLTTGKTGKIWSTVAPVVKPIATGLGVAGALMSPSADAAAADIVLPGAIGELGVSDEQAELDRKYRQRIRESLQRKK